MHLGLLSRFVLILAASGWIVSVVNLMHLAERSGWMIPVVDDLPSLLVSTLLVIIAGLTPVAVRMVIQSARPGEAQTPGKKRKPVSVGKALYNGLSSIQLTIMLLAGSVILVFFGTLDQVHYGIYHAQNKYFAHAFVVWEYPQQFIWGERLSWFHLTMPGGYLLGPLLVANLSVAHFRYFRPSWKKVGIPLIHGGIVLLLLGQLWTQVKQVDYFMWLGEGESSNFVEAFHYDEFVIIDKGDSERDRVYSWDVAALENANGVISHEELPFVIDVVWFAKNAAIFPRSAARTEYGTMPFDRGLGAERDYVVLAMPPTYAEGERNVTSAIIRLSGEEGRIGTWLVSNIFRQTLPLREFFPVQSFEYQGREYEVAIRFKRAYLPAELELIEFRHDRYPGTDIPHNFSSEMRIHNPETGTSRNTLIYMNHPLRFGGLTFYQASFADEDTKSMLQVVSNPARWVPYISSLIISLGLTLQFVISLFVHARRRKTS
ncbi:MAG: cytochrome c biogenesis protein ResB [Opitutales bacterium]|nr:cytochrome c biogenesis protein ResB [Opitutales bacterium]